MEKNIISLFDDKEIRKTLVEWKWWYVVEDVVFALTASNNTRQYLKDLKRYDESFRADWENTTIQIIDTKWWKQKMVCADTDWILRLVQSITSKKAEPYKKWLARLWNERIKELENQEYAVLKSEIFVKDLSVGKRDIDG